MKGQVYITVTILILIFLVLLRVETNISPQKVNPPLFDYYHNIREEAIQTVDLSLLNEDKIETSLDNFISLTSDTLDERGIESTMSYSVKTTGNSIEVSFDLYLKSGKSFLSDTITIERKVYE